MKERVTYQIGDTVQAYDGCIGTVVYTHESIGSTFPDEQRIWMKCPNGRVLDAAAEYFRATSADRLTKLTKDKVFA